LILEIGSGKAAKGVVDIYPNKKDMSPILLSLSQVKHLLGMELSLEEIKKGLLSLGFECQIRSPSELQATPPYWRTDVKSAADVVEEVARIIGYDRIPLTLLSSPLPKLEPDPILALREKVRDILASCGFQEVISYSLTSREKLARISPQVKPLRVVNPMSREQEYLRTTLRANLLTILSSNQKHEENGIRLFEIGKIYLPQEKSLPQEREMLAAVLSGPRTELSWFNGEGYLGFFDAKGVVETLLGRLGVEADFRLGGDESLHPGRTAIVTVEGNPVGVIGELHPGIAKSFDLSPFPVALLKIELDRLLPLATKAGKYHPLPRFPTSTRDIAIVVDAEVSAKKIQGIISASPLVSQVTLFDLYTGEQVPPGKKSLAFRVVYQSPTHTLVEEEVHQVEREILAKLYGELGATLRG
jgi:phenylalanyl-tRNA synthetase beta chain